MKGEPLLKVEDLSVRLGRERALVVDGVEFTIGAGERVALLGPSGCGKTTTLRAIAGFERAAGGRIQVAGRMLSEASTHVAPDARGMGMVFQEFALFPHLDVAENVAFGLNRLGRSERRARTAQLLSLVGLDALARRYPGELSGGQQQRVALARALAPRPALLLLDEPFSSLDAGLRRSTRRHTEQVLASVGAAALLVTHDQEEAMAFAERLIVMKGGKVEQSGTPEVLYRQPRTAFVARFLGEANLLEALAEGGQARTALGPVALGAPAQGAVSLCIRPHALRMSEASGVRGHVLAREFRGSSCFFSVEVGGASLSVEASGEAPWRVGDAVGLEVVEPAAVLEGSIT